MRQIKFRALCAITGVWRYGFYYTSKGNHIIRDEQDKESIVLPATVGQFTGLTDKNGKDIFEGDFLRGSSDDKCLVIWRQDLASFALTKDGWAYDHYFGEAIDPGFCEIIGTIHDRKEVEG